LGVGLESSEDLASDTAPAPRRLHEHSFDLPNIRFQFTNRSTTNRPTISICNKKRKPTLCDVFWMKTVKGDAGISITQVLIESLNEDKGFF
jgi:hypothetical protein